MGDIRWRSKDWRVKELSCCLHSPYGTWNQGYNEVIGFELSQNSLGPLEKVKSYSSPNGS